MMAYIDDRDRLNELLADRALEGLSAAEERELEDLRRKLRMAEDESLDAAAAVLALGFAAEEPAEELPANLGDRIATEASAFFADRGAAGPADAGAARGDAGAAGDVIDLPSRRPRAIGNRWGWFAAAACLALAILAWWNPRGGDDGAPLPGKLRNELLASADDGITRLGWTATEDRAARGVSGDIVWSDERQEGYMRFRGLPVNDPGEWQYQLWIFDAERDERYPVDGGVFDIAAGADEVVVPIQARLPVADAVLFAVTIEKPGGVVVSSRERLVVLADVSAGTGS